MRPDDEAKSAAKGELALKPPVQANPYRVSEKVVPGHVVSDDTNLNVVPASRARITLWALVYFYPIWLITAFYLTWLIAWIQLGYRPRPMLDDPKSIGGLMDLVYPVPGIIAMAMPILAPLGFVAAFFYPVNANGGDRYTIRTALALFYIALCVLTLVLLRADGGRLVEWWSD